MAQLGAAGVADGLTDLELSRRQMDEIDEQIIALLTTRRDLSHRIQEQRLAAGGLRLDLERERLIHRRYREALGDVGIDIAGALLRLSRGRTALEVTRGSRTD